MHSVFVLELKDRTVLGKNAHSRLSAWSEIRGCEATSADPHPVPGGGGRLGPCFGSAFHERFISKHSNLFKAGLFHCQSSVVRS